MPQSFSDTAEFKQLLKDALRETLDEQRELFIEVFAEVIEDFRLSEAIEEGNKTDFVDEEEVLDILKGKRVKTRYRGGFARDLKRFK